MLTERSEVLNWTEKDVFDDGQEGFSTETKRIETKNKLKTKNPKSTKILTTCLFDS